MTARFWIPLILACFSPGMKGAEASQRILRVQLTSEPVSLDPARAEDGVSLRILGNVMEGLVGYDGSGKLVNRIAASVLPSRDGKTFRFKLRKDAKWSDGKAVTASEFVAGINRARDPATASKVAGLLGPIDSVEESQGDVIIRLREPTSYFLQSLALSAALPVRADVLAGLAESKDRWPLTAPSTGPYRIVRHQPDTKFVLERNPHYAGRARADAPSQVELVIVSDESTGVALFEQGQLDILTRVPSLEFERMRKKGVVKVDPFHATYYIAFNTRVAPMNEPAWRKAVAGSVDRPGIVAAIGTGETPACSWVPVGLEGHFACPPEAARLKPFEQAMAEVRGKAAARKGELHGAFDSSSRNSLVMEKIQADLKKSLGLELSLINQDWKTYVRGLSSPRQIYRFGWLAPFADPISHLEVFTTGNPNNYTGWSSPAYDALVREIARMKPGKARAARIVAAQKILLEDETVVVPIYHYVQTHAVSPRVSGFRVSPFGVIRFDELGVR